MTGIDDNGPAPWAVSAAGTAVIGQRWSQSARPGREHRRTTGGQW